LVGPEQCVVAPLDAAGPCCGANSSESESHTP
jgi:hypothetical protein